MTLPVSLLAVIDEMDTFGDNFHPYINRQTGELVTLSSDDLCIVEEGFELADYPEWQQEILQKTVEVLDSDAYVPLPGKFAIHEYAIMQRFCFAVEDAGLSRELQDQIHGAGAFRRFKNTLTRHNMLDTWFACRQAAFTEIAIKWLEEHNIPYIRDVRD
ncbi:conserved hypothetical protein [Chlorobium limicola DSM 245]|uniref:Uncharacterized protein n=1 Tax=Chlorobium limicola (strain DSM 245 / NBRC 103803 / 6330) TaxID=290315 RepID=B3EGZ2_CHLL2|nr:UPF0158 family protein [Chlorobium limicola]ACD89672.1 conserved hypothetical protein [Chlorobium limicola DSM 245]